MGGVFTFRRVGIAWSFKEDGELEGQGFRQWVLQAELGDVLVARRFPGELTQEEARAEVDRILPELFRVAEAWMKG